MPTPPSPQARPARFATPLGPLVVHRVGACAVRAAFDPPDDDAVPEADADDPLRRDLDDYFAGRRLDALAAHAVGPLQGFQAEALARVRRIPPGQTRTYGQLAAELSRPGAARAVGRANATNPVCLFTPCHRVVGAGNRLTGYAFGLERKRWLLAHEGAL